MFTISYLYIYSSLGVWVLPVYFKIEYNGRYILMIKVAKCTREALYKYGYSNYLNSQLKCDLLMEEALQFHTA